MKKELKNILENFEKNNFENDDLGNAIKLLFVRKIEELESANISISHYGSIHSLNFNIDAFRVGRLIEKLDQCIGNINDFREELDFLNPELVEWEDESIFELEGGQESFHDPYEHSVFTELIKKDSRSDDTPF